MKKGNKRIILLTLAVMMLLSMSVPAFAASKQYSDYCAIGDSIATGYGPLDGYGWESHYFSVCDRAYPGLVRDTLGAKYHSLTTVASRLVDYLWMLNVTDDEYDYESGVSYHGAGYMEAIAAMRGGPAADRIRASSLVSIALGNMDIFIYPRNEAAADGGFSIEAFIRLATEGYESFIIDYPRLINRIKEINPTTTILLVGQFNPFANYTFTGVLGTLYSEFMDLMLMNLNNHLKLWASMYSNCIYVDVTEVGTTFDTAEISDTQLMDVLGGHENHPGAEGHRMIADKILNSLPNAWRKILLPQSGINHLEINGTAAGNYTIRSSGLGCTLRTLDGKYVNYDYTSDSIVYGTTAKTKWIYSGGFVTITLKPISYISIIGRKIPIYGIGLKYINLDTETGELIASSARANAAVYVAN